MTDVAAEIRTIPGLDTERIDLQIVQRAMKHPDSADTLNASSLYMQCWCVAFKGLVYVPPRIRTLVLFRWGGDGEVIQVFCHMAQTSVDHGGRNGLIEL